MKKSGVSPLIASVMLIAFVIILFVLVSTWTRRAALEPSMEISEEKLASSFEAMNTQIEIRKVELSGNSIKLTVSNEGNIEIKELNVRVIGDKDVDLQKVSNLDLKNLEVKTVSVGFDNSKTGLINKVEVIPVIGSGIAISAMKSKTDLEKDETLVAYYGFEGNANDLSGNGNDGTLNGGMACIATGKIGQACSFDGVNDYILTQNGYNLNEITISVWIKYTKIPEDFSTIIDFGSVPNSIYMESFFGSNSILVGANVGSGGNAFYGSTNELSIAITLNQWTNIIQIVNSTTMSVYKDGVYINSITGTYDLSKAQSPLHLEDIIGVTLMV